LKAETGGDDEAKRGRASGCAAQRLAVRDETAGGRHGSLFPAGFSEAVSREESVDGMRDGITVRGDKHYPHGPMWLLRRDMGEGGWPGAVTPALGGAAGFRGGRGTAVFDGRRGTSPDGGVCCAEERKGERRGARR